MDIYWLEQTEADVPAGNQWLGPSEATRLEKLRFDKRRVDWRLGRWTAKRALASYLSLRADDHSFASIEIRPASSGAPVVYLADQRSPLTISLSHRGGRAVCAIAPSATALGCDLEIIEPHSESFVADYFTQEERRLVALASGPNRLRLLALLWSSKESALKALGTGLRLDTRSVVVTFVDQSWYLEEEQISAVRHCPTEDLSGAFPRQDGDGWHPLRVHCLGGQIFQGWWLEAGDFLRTVVADPPPTRPTPLRFTTSV